MKGTVTVTQQRTKQRAGTQAWISQILIYFYKLNGSWWAYPTDREMCRVQGKQECQNRFLKIIYFKNTWCIKVSSQDKVSTCETSLNLSSVWRSVGVAFNLELAIVERGRDVVAQHIFSWLTISKDLNSSVLDITNTVFN